MKKLVFLVLLASACSDSKTSTTPDAPTQPTPDGPAAATCFQGTPVAHNDIINACVDSSVTVIIKYPTLQAKLAALPKLNPDGSLPPLQ
ncbi:MAG TPA: hypothetical protein VF469_19480 [Kofleriaceae bacterium]